MFVNGKDTKKLFKARVIEYSINPAERNKLAELMGMHIMYLNLGNAAKAVNIKFDIVASSSQELQYLKSQLESELMRCTLRFNDHEFMYDGWCENFTVTQICSWIEQISVTLYCVCYKAEETIALTNATSQSIKVQGTTRTPCIYEIKALTSIIDFEINGIKVHDIPINTTLVIDGEKCLILLDGKNKFLDTELTEFPYLDPGSNTIKMNNTNCEVKIKYRPRFV